MRRLARYTFNALTALSLLLCVATLVLWSRSSSRWDEAGWQARSGRLYSVTSRLGGLCFDVTDGWPFRQVWNGRAVWKSDPLLIASLPPPSEWSWHGFGWDRQTHGIGIQPTGWTGRGSSTSLIVPHWAMTIALAMPPLLRLVQILRRRRRNHGGCQACGYDLTGNVSGICPECGTPVPVVRQPLPTPLPDQHINYLR